MEGNQPTCKENRKWSGQSLHIPHCSSTYQAGSLAPQDLCTCHAFYSRKYIPQRYTWLTPLPHLPEFSSTCHLISESFLTTLFKITNPTHPNTPYPCFIFPHSTCQHLTDYMLLIYGLVVCPHTPTTTRAPQGQGLLSVLFIRFPRA